MSSAMRPLAFLVRLLLASALASAVAGFLVFFLLLLLTRVAMFGPEAALGSLLLATLISLSMGGFAIVPAVTVLTAPTFLVGGCLWLLGSKRPWARRRTALAIAGALLGGLASAVLVPANGLVPLEAPAPLGLARHLGFVIFLIAGALSGLAFRSAMAMVGTFFGDEADPQEQMSGGGAS
jgi:hypothetical protein